MNYFMHKKQKMAFCYM